MLYARYETLLLIFIAAGSALTLQRRDDLSSRSVEANGDYSLLGGFLRRHEDLTTIPGLGYRSLLEDEDEGLAQDFNLQRRGPCLSKNGCTAPRVFSNTISKNSEHITQEKGTQTSPQGGPPSGYSDRNTAGQPNHDRPSYTPIRPQSAEPGVEAKHGDPMSLQRLQSTSTEDGDTVPSLRRLNTPDSFPTTPGLSRPGSASGQPRPGSAGSLKQELSAKSEAMQSRRTTASSGYADSVGLLTGDSFPPPERRRGWQQSGAQRLDLGATGSGRFPQILSHGGGSGAESITGPPIRSDSAKAIYRVGPQSVESTTTSKTPLRKRDIEDFLTRRGGCLGKACGKPSSNASAGGKSKGPKPAGGSPMSNEGSMHTQQSLGSEGSRRSKIAATSQRRFDMAHVSGRLGSADIGTPKKGQSPTGSASPGTLAPTPEVPGSSGTVRQLFPQGASPRRTSSGEQPSKLKTTDSKKSIGQAKGAASESEIQPDLTRKNVGSPKKTGSGTSSLETYDSIGKHPGIWAGAARLRSDGTIITDPSGQSSRAPALGTLQSIGKHPEIWARAARFKSDGTITTKPSGGGGSPKSAPKNPPSGRESFASSDTAGGPLVPFKDAQGMLGTMNSMDSGGS